MQDRQVHARNSAGYLPGFNSFKLFNEKISECTDVTLLFFSGFTIKKLGMLDNCFVHLHYYVHITLVEPEVVFLFQQFRAMEACKSM